MPLISLPASEQALARSLLARAIAFNTKPVPSDALSLRVGEKRIGLLMPSTLKQIQSTDLSRWFVLDSDGINFVPTTDLNTALAQCARRFHDAGFFFQWRNEKLDIRCQDTQQTVAQAERGLFRYFGLPTACVYAVGLTDDNRIFMSRRSLNKQVDPGLWDALAAGLIASGENPEQALRREILEEAGLSASDYDLLGTWRHFRVCRPVEEGWMHEEAFCLNVRVNNPDAVHNIDGEVSDIELVEPSQLLARIEAQMVPWDTAIAFLTALVES